MIQTVGSRFARLVRAAHVFLLVGLMAGCAVNPVTGERQFSLMGEAREIELGREDDQQIVAEMGLHPDPALASVADCACGSRTYDLVGGGHRGTDIFPLFGWRKLDNEEVIVVAAAPGTIVLKQDGNQDRSCGTLSVLLPNASQWNAVSLRHADGSLTWYGHLKKNSLTPKKVGDTVDEGEYLGAVGSSGFSTGPHMHFEV